MSNIILRETKEYLIEFFGDEINSIFVEKAVFVLFFSGVKLSTGHGGLCFTPIKDIPKAVCCPSSAKAMPLSGKLKGRSIIKYLNDIEHDNILRRTLAIACLNALSTLYWDRKEVNYNIRLDVDAFDDIIIPKKGKTVVIGALVPILKRLIKENADFKVLEMDSRTLKGKELEYFEPAELADKFLPDADLVVITGTTLINNTLPDLLEYTKKDAQIIVTGPTVSMIPEAFFKRGVTVLGGIIVTKPDELLDLISEGGSGYHFFGKSAERFVIEKC